VEEGGGGERNCRHRMGCLITAASFDVVSEEVVCIKLLLNPVGYDVRKLSQLLIFQQCTGCYICMRV